MPSAGFAIARLGPYAQYAAGDPRDLQFAADQKLSTIDSTSVNTQPNLAHHGFSDG
jgi:hypothetical protein